MRKGTTREAGEGAAPPAEQPAPLGAVGLIETFSLTAAIQAADAAVKAADVSLVGYHVTRGKGWVCVKVEGEVAAVQAAVDAAVEWGGRVNQVVASHVIPRPVADTEPLIRSKDTVGSPRYRTGEAGD